MFKGIVTVGSQVDVSFTAAATNTGSSSLLSGFIPLTHTGSTHSQFDMVAPAGSVVQPKTVPSSYALDIRVDVPGQFDSGILEIFENGVLKDRGTVGDVIWTYAVV